MDTFDEDELSIEQLLELVTQFNVVSEEDRERLRKLLIERTGSANIEDAESLVDSIKTAGNGSRLTYEPTDYEYILFAVVGAFMLIVLGIVGYALFRSLTARERRRQEKLAKRDKSKKKK